MQKHTFTCPFCSRKMEVGTELLGRMVRCPHCKQAVTAPAPPVAAGETPQTAPGSSGGSPADSSPPESKGDLAATIFAPEVPVFQMPHREGAESIFGEAEEGEEIFSSTAGTRIAIPELPRRTLPVDGTGTSSEPILSEPGVPQTVPTEGTTPASTQVVSAPTASTSVEPSVVPAAPDQPNPWAEMDPATPPLDSSVPSNHSAVELASASNEPRSGRSRTGDSSRRPGSGTALVAGGPTRSVITVGFFVLLPYALLMTALAVYGLVLRPGVPEGHPLSTIPDDFGEFPASDRKKVSKRSFPIHGELPPELKVALGGKLELGDIEIEPAKVEVRPLALFVKSATRTTPELPRATPALVLTLRIRNRSANLWIHPMDPAFTRKAHGTDEPATGLEVGGRKFWGGSIDWPLANRNFERVYERAQEEDAVPLGPGEWRDYVVFTDTDGAILEAVANAGTPLLWRVQVRRGLIEYRGKEIPVTAVIGIEFQRDDVDGLS
jgi:hypothetical protein